MHVPQNRPIDWTLNLAYPNDYSDVLGFTHDSYKCLPSGEVFYTWERLYYYHMRGGKDASILTSGTFDKDKSDFIWDNQLSAYALLYTTLLYNLREKESLTRPLLSRTSRCVCERNVERVSVIERKWCSIVNDAMRRMRTELSD